MDTRDQESPEFWARVDKAQKAARARKRRTWLARDPKTRAKVMAYQAAWYKKRRLDPDYLARDRELRAAAMVRFRAKKKAGA